MKILITDSGFNNVADAIDIVTDNTTQDDWSHDCKYTVKECDLPVGFKIAPCCGGLALFDKKGCHHALIQARRGRIAVYDSYELDNGYKPKPKFYLKGLKLAK